MHMSKKPTFILQLISDFFQILGKNILLICTILRRATMDISGEWVMPQSTAYPTFSRLDFPFYISSSEDNSSFHQLTPSTRNIYFPCFCSLFALLFQSSPWRIPSETSWEEAPPKANIFLPSIWKIFPRIIWKTEGRSICTFPLYLSSTGKNTICQSSRGLRRRTEW